MKYELSDFRNIEKLGEGTYGIVFKALNLITNEFAAIKQIKSENDDEGFASTSLREIAVLKELQHPNIVSMLQTIVDKSTLYMVFEYLDKDLYKYIKESPHVFVPEVVKNFSYQMMQGLFFCHAKGYIHRDLKPQNILIDTVKGIVKIGDFGLARKYGAPVKQLTHEVVTLYYRAPEILLNTKRYSCAIDVWSVACIIVEMASGVPLFDGDSEIDQLFTIFKILGTITDKVWPGLTKLTGWNPAFPIWSYKLDYYLQECLDPQCIDLLDKMLTYYPPYRISLRDALKHEWFQDVEKSAMPAFDEEIKSCPETSELFYNQRDLE